MGALAAQRELTVRFLFCKPSAASPKTTMSSLDSTFNGYTLSQTGSGIVTLYSMDAVDTKKGMLR
jgi:hypothetical protein